MNLPICRFEDRLLSTSLSALAIGLLCGGADSLRAQDPERNLSLIEPKAGDPAGGALRLARERADQAIAHVYVEIDGVDVFKIERPSSGVLIGDQGFVVTFLDLVAESIEASDKRILVHLKRAGLDPLPARIRSIDESRGLVLLEVEGLADEQKANGLTLAESSLGQDVLVYSFGEEQAPTGFVGVTMDALGASRFRSGGGSQSIDRGELVFTDAAIQERNHGGALLDVDGRLVGLCNATQVVNFEAIREPTLEQLKQPSFGFAVSAMGIARAFDDCDKPSPAVDGPSLGNAIEATVSVFTGRAPKPSLDDPYARSRRNGVGSGVVLTESGLVLTNAHLVRGESEITVRIGGRDYEARVVDSSRAGNLALLQVEVPASDKLPAVVVRADSPRVGERVYALGRPNADEQLAVSSGVVSALRADGRVIQTDARLGNENGGGPLVDAYGRLIGLCDAGRVDRIDAAYARRGDGAKVENSLNQTPSFALVESALGDALTDGGFLKSTARAESSDRALDAVIDQIAPSLLNIYIEAVVRGEVDEDNPFAQPETRTVVTSLGSGVVIDPSGLALTNWHVVDAATFPDGAPRSDHVVRARNFEGEIFEVTVLSISREEDLSLIQLELAPGRTLRAVEFGVSGDLEVGDRAVAAGNPEGQANSITVGVVTAKDQEIKVRGRWADLTHLLETDAAINGGNSGGALLDARGRLIGINSAGGAAFNVTGYAISVDHVRERLHNLLLGAYKMRTPWLGLQVQDRSEGGVFVQAVNPEGPAGRAGVERGWVLRSVGGEPVGWSVDFSLLRRSLEGGEPVELEFEVEGATVSKTLTSLPHDIWLVQRELGLEIAPLTIRDDADRIREAAVALYRNIVGDPEAEPRQIPGRVLEVKRVFAGDKVEAGDLLLGVRLTGRVRSGGAAQIVRFGAAREIHDFVNEHAAYEGSTFEVFLYREGEVLVVPIGMRRLLY
ncbi:MAG: trypsin-like peptidase domain-containing protein [Planctomycetota bacterium]